MTLTFFQELLLTSFNVHEILGFEILCSEKHFCYEEISEVCFVRFFRPSGQVHKFSQNPYADRDADKYNCNAM